MAQLGSSCWLQLLLLCGGASLAHGFVLTSVFSERATTCTHFAKQPTILLLSTDAEATRDPEPSVRLSYKDWLATNKPRASTVPHSESTRDASSPVGDVPSDGINRVSEEQRMTAPTADTSETTAAETPAEKFAKFRERQRQRALGAPVHVWSQSAEMEDPPDAKPHVPVPPTPEQAAAANALAEAMLSSSQKMPDLYVEGKGGYLQELEFGEDLDELAEGIPRHARDPSS